MRNVNSFNMYKTRTISITSGKGGVGKTTMVANLALALSQKGKKVLILDGDLGMANVDIFFGVKPQGNIHDILAGRKEMKDILTEVSKDVFLIPGGSGVVEFNHMNHFERRAMVEAISSLPLGFDYLLIDTAPGIAENVLFLNSAAQTVSVVITPDPSSFADAYALIKVLNKQYKVNHFAIICNQVRDEQEGLNLYQRFNDVVNRFLYIGLDYWGSVPTDVVLKKAVQQQRLIVRHDVGAESSKAIRQVCSQIERSSKQVESTGGMQMFWDQVVGFA
ncbi:MAG: flagellar biosynthesis switch protein [Bdellovibrio sp. ArHS]|uniref:MinD/ParA family protein n=1 Tax=Bdellovibrio sp. ArHS TaxID=1569284 RepID=UPI00058350E3|nr:MinD/ParA family protein [Bdellovibrio sp. ArHS]KHD89132.1 MAG: flagellar biosynthesis switch protein [Bdellovibrio sp. ArHS]